MPTPDWFSELLSSEINRWVRLSESQIGQLYQHYDLLLRWNRRMNLTTVKPGRETVIRHYCESLFFTFHLPGDGERTSVLDLGSGPGFPGSCLAVLKPEWHVTLVESSQRKAVFLRESSRHLKNVTVLADRMENVGVECAWVVARAVDPEGILALVPRLAPNIGLMLGEDDFPIIRSYSRIAWAEPIRLPWGDRRLCVYGNVSREATTDVPRET